MKLIEIRSYPALSGPDGEGRMDIDGCELAVLRGDSGAGKSRLLRRLLRLDPEPCGEMLLEGRPIQDWDLLELRRYLILVPQDPPKPPRTVWQMWQRIAAFRNNRDCVQDAELVQLFERLDISEQATRPLSELSGGEARRIWLAMAFGLKRTVLLLDEPSSGLDARRSRALWDLVREQNQQGSSAIWVSHEALPDPSAQPRSFHIRSEPQ